MKSREYALANLENQDLINLAVAHNVHNERGFGPEGDSAYHNHIYKNAKKDAEIIDGAGNKKNLTEYLLEKSRKEGQLYSGQIYEKKLIEEASKSIETALNDVTVEDILRLIGSNKSVNEKYKGKTLAEFYPKRDENLTDEENKKRLGEMKLKDVQEIQKQTQFAESLKQAYFSYISKKRVSEALAKSAEIDVKGDLENLVCETEETH